MTDIYRTTKNHPRPLYTYARTWVYTIAFLASAVLMHFYGGQ